MTRSRCLQRPSSSPKDTASAPPHPPGSSHLACRTHSWFRRCCPGRCLARRERIRPCRMSWPLFRLHTPSALKLRGCRRGLPGTWSSSLDSRAPLRHQSYPQHTPLPFCSCCQRDRRIRARTHQSMRHLKALSHCRTVPPRIPLAQTNWPCSTRHGYMALAEPHLPHRCCQQDTRRTHRASR